MTIQEQCTLTLPRFEETAGKVPWCPRSILKSEGLAVCAMADLHKIDLLIESGVCNGRSTEMWCRYGVNVYAIDWAVKDEARERLKRFSLTIREGDACDVIREVIEVATTTGDYERIGVFIDGPKDDAAVKLAVECMRYPAVQFVGVHDMAVCQAGGLHRARHDLAVQTRVDGDDPTWFTNADWFVELSHHLDVDESRLDEEQGTRWTPYCRNEIGKAPVSLGSYGYTIGFLSRELSE